MDQLIKISEIDNKQFSVTKYFKGILQMQIQKLFELTNVFDKLDFLNTLLV